MTATELIGWDRLRHGGLLLDPQRLRRLAETTPPPPHFYVERDLRRHVSAVLDGSADIPEFVTFVLQRVCNLSADHGIWVRGAQVGVEWSRSSITGEVIRPRQLWRAHTGGTLPVFFDVESRIGIGRGRKRVSEVLQWLRAGPERLALLTNGRQWRLIFAGLDFDAYAEWDVDLWFEEGELAPQVSALRTLLAPALWTEPSKDAPAPLLQAILDSRKGQAELSAVLGERVREAVEQLVLAHNEALSQLCADVDPADVYRAACRVVMRMVVVLFAESRELLPRDNAIYHSAYGLGGLIEELDRIAVRGGNRLKRAYSAWPRVLALFRLVASGSHHPDLAVPAYGGELFGAAAADATDGLTRALHVFETACYDHELNSDHDVRRMLELITRTRVKVRQGRSSTSMVSPVDFSDLSSEYIGILYEGLLDFELKTAPSGDPIIFLAVGSQPALPLSRLESMDDKALKSLLEKMKDTSSDDHDEESAEEPDEESPVSDDEASTDDDEDGDETPDESESDDDARLTTRTRAEQWARRAVLAGGLVPKLRGKSTPEKQLAHAQAIDRKARQIVTKVILPGERYLVRWGGTRKGSGTFYTRPGLAIPTVHRTLRPLAWNAPTDANGVPDRFALAKDWSPKKPEEILALKVCDPACGSGTFPVAALRFLTDSLYASLHHHGRVSNDGDRGVVRLLEGPPAQDVVPEERLGDEQRPCRSDDPLFEPRLKAILRRHVVERCIYGVDLDPLAVELCRLALWIETMDRTLPFSFLDHKIKCGNGLVGAWFDQFQHYPVMAWKNRVGGDKGHTNGVHFEKEARTKALKAFAKGLADDLADALRGQMKLFAPPSGSPTDALSEARTTLTRMHELSVQDSDERARLYRDEFIGGESYQALKSAMDLWCACWFWPAEAVDDAPLPSNFASPSQVTIATAARVAARKRFFHWELEFPDVFRDARSGFDGVLGNPPWENLQPNPEEFFSNVDPLFRGYGNLEKRECLRRMFTERQELERDWLDYCADFNALSHWVTDVGAAFGDPGGAVGAESFSLGKGSRELHARWREVRACSRAFSDTDHPFRHQLGRVFTYKLFLEQSYALLGRGGRMGQIVPSGIYSDAWSQPLRELFLDRCRWEWLFGFENRDGIFEIHRSFKFTPIIVEKGGATEAIQTAFMRRKLEDWERAESLATPYTRAQVDQFSPRSKAILEIQSKRDLEILEKIYANSVLLGDEGPNGWGIQYKLEFMMNTDAHLFPSRLKWEEQGYRPDEYSRWLKGDWRPIAELWSELGVQPLPAGERRCAQPPYDTLPIPRADIPAGIILSRDADAWIRESAVEDTALPLYEGRMIDQFEFSSKGWVSGKGRSSVWRYTDAESKPVEPQFLMSASEYAAAGNDRVEFKVSIMDVTSSTNARTLIATALGARPTGHKTPTLTVPGCEPEATLALAAVANALVFDYVVRSRLGGNSLVWAVLSETAVAQNLKPHRRELALRSLSLSLPSVGHAPQWLELLCALPESPTKGWRARWAETAHERLRLRVNLDAVTARLFELDMDHMRAVLRECDGPLAGLLETARTYDSKGFWRVDKGKDPELRHTVLTLVAFHDLEKNISACGGDRDRGIEAFLTQSDGEGWLLPETVRLADYGLGHDDRAKEPQTVASRLGPRFYDWQLAQSAEESWRECHLHARNLLGDQGYRDLLERADAVEVDTSPHPRRDAATSPSRGQVAQGDLFG
jgi:hypothetical protein